MFTKFKRGLTDIQGKLLGENQTNVGDDVDNEEMVQKARPKTMRELVEDEVGIVEEYHFQLP
jgi:hypothetical protein